MQTEDCKMFATRELAELYLLHRAPLKEHFAELQQTDPAGFGRAVIEIDHPGYWRYWIDTNWSSQDGRLVAPDWWDAGAGAGACKLVVRMSAQRACLYPILQWHA